MNINLIYGLLLLIGSHIIAWFQLNSQFKWEWAKEHTWIMVLMGIPCSYLFIWATKYTVEGMGGLLWPTRFIGFGVGMVIYAILVNHFFSEGFNIKTIISLLISIALISIQIFWKN